MSQETLVIVIDWVKREHDVLIFNSRADATDTLAQVFKTLSYDADPACKGPILSPTSVKTGSMLWEIV